MNKEVSELNEEINKLCNILYEKDKEIKNWKRKNHDQKIFIINLIKSQNLLLRNLINANDTLKIYRESRIEECNRYLKELENENTYSLAE